MLVFNQIMNTLTTSEVGNTTIDVAPPLEADEVALLGEVAFAGASREPGETWAPSHITTIHSHFIESARLDDGTEASRITVPRNPLDNPFRHSEKVHSVVSRLAFTLFDIRNTDVAAPGIAISARA
jgi:hypothetical protein